MDFLLLKKAGNPLFCCKNGLSGGKTVKTGLYSYGEIGQLLLIKLRRLSMENTSNTKTK